MPTSSDPQMQAVMAMYYNQMLQYSVLAQNMNNSSSNNENKSPVQTPSIPPVPNMPPVMPMVPQQMLQQQIEMQQDGRQRKFACSICGMLFFTRHVKEQHELTHTNLKPYSCNICGFKARQKAVIWRHKKNRHPDAESSVSMDVLTSGMPSSPECEEDEEEDSSNQMNPSQVTTPDSENNESNSFPSAAPSNMPNLTAISAISPTALSQIPQSLGSIQPNPMASDPSKPYVCNTCGRGFKNKYILSQHSMIHSNVRRYACDICGFRAKQMSVIYNHKRNKHWGKKTDHEMINSAINIIPQHMSNNITFERNMTTHQSAIDNEVKSKTNENRDDAQSQEGSLKDIELEVQNAQRTMDGYLCRICGRSLKTKMILQEHIMTHYNIRRYHCNYCNYRAKQRAGLYNHMKVKHKGLKPIRPLKNKRINLGFTSSFMAEKSMRFNPFNPTRRKHVCRTCGKSFRIKHVLEQHELIHLNIKRYACKYCGFKGKQKSVIYRHNQLKHADKKACVVDTLKGRIGGFKPIEIKPVLSVEKKEELTKKITEENLIPTDLSKPKEVQTVKKEERPTEIITEPIVKEETTPDHKEKLRIHASYMTSTPQHFKPQVSFMPQLMGSNLVYSVPMQSQPTTPSPRPVVTTIQPQANGADTPPALYSSYGTPDKPHRCKTCGRCFRLRHVMEQHELTHSNFRKYMCDICGFRAKQKAVIYRHKKVKHPNHPGAGRVALVPEMSTPNQQSMVSRPIDIPPQLIPINKISPSNNPELAHNNNKGMPPVIRISPSSEHNIKTMDDEKPSPTGSLTLSPHSNMGWYLPPDKDDSEDDIDEDMEFSTGDSLATNMAMGLPSMAPSANSLNLSLPTMPPLSPEQHSPGSEGNKKYSCKVCGRSFKHRHVLEQHYITHTGLRPYKCEFCDFCARQKASLWRHKQKHLIPAQQ